jgi:Phycobilisome protein
MDTTNSLRLHPQLSQLFKDAESRHLTDAEFELFLKAAPQFSNRVNAAKEIKTFEVEVVDTTIQEVFKMYPFIEKHEFAQGKCYRDVHYVSAYSTMAMLMNDPEWFRDKLLIWLKTILQAFHFPARDQKSEASASQRIVSLEADKLPQPRSSIFETYSRLKHNYKDKLSPETYALIEPMLQLSCDILASE